MNQQLTEKKKVWGPQNNQELSTSGQVLASQRFSQTKGRMMKF